MSLALTISVVLAPLVLGIIGALRDTRRGLFALLGTLGGAILAEFWAARWAAGLAGGLFGDRQGATFLVSCTVFLWGALVVGYAGGLLLSRVKDRPSFLLRLGNALLGLLNGALIVGFLLRYATVQETSVAATVRATPAARTLHEGLPLLFLGLATAVTLLVIGRGLMVLTARRAPPPKAESGAQPGQPASTPDPDRRIDDRDVLGKVKDATRR